MFRLYKVLVRNLLKEYCIYLIIIYLCLLFNSEKFLTQTTATTITIAACEGAVVGVLFFLNTYKTIPLKRFPWIFSLPHKKEQILTTYYLVKATIVILSVSFALIAPLIAITYKQ